MDRVTDFSDFSSLGSFAPTSSASLTANFGASLLGTAISWTGSGNYNLNSNNTAWTPSFTVDTSNAAEIATNLLSGLGVPFFSLGDQIPILGPLASELNQPLPIIGQSIARLTGLDKYLPTLPSLPSGGLVNGTYQNFEGTGGTLTVGVNRQTISELLNGQTVDLLSWTTGEGCSNDSW